MAGGRMRRFRTWLALAVGLCLPLAALSSPTPASATGIIPVLISVGSSANPSTLGQDVTYTVTLTTTNEGALDPTDGIQFQDNGNAIPNCNNQLLSGFAPPGIYTATCDEPANSLSVGDHVITANFYGDGNYQPATATLVPDQVVQQATTTTTITSPSPGTLITYGNESQLFFNVNVAGVAGINQSPTGNVTFYAAAQGAPGPGAYLCSTGVNGGGGLSNGNCYINDTTLNAGPYVLTAVYGGDDNYIGSSSSPQDLTIEQVTTQMQVFPVPGYALYGAENGNFFIVGVGGNNNNGSASGSVSITADGVNLVGPRRMPSQQRRRQSLLHRLGHRSSGLHHALYRDVELPGRCELPALVDDCPSLHLPDYQLDLADRVSRRPPRTATRDRSPSRPP